MRACVHICVRARSRRARNVPSIRFFIHLYARLGSTPFHLPTRRCGGGNINFKIFCRAFPRSTRDSTPRLPAPSRAAGQHRRKRGRAARGPVGRRINLQSRKQDGALSILLIKCQQLNCAGTSNGRDGHARRERADGKGGRRRGNGRGRAVRGGGRARERSRVKGNIELVF